MATEENVISFEKIEELVKNEEATLSLQWYGEEMIVKRKLSLGEMLVFVNAIVDNCFDDDLKYIPEAADYIRRCAVLELYANFRLPQEAEKRYEFVYSDAMSEALEMILSVIDAEQYSEILSSAQEKIDYRISTDVERANRRVDEAARSLNELEDQLRELFSGVTSDDVKGMIGALANGIDEEKIVNAIVNAGYIGTPVEQTTDSEKFIDDAADSVGV